jgi:hypothetical protein
MAIVSSGPDSGAALAAWRICVRSPVAPIESLGWCGADPPNAGRLRPRPPWPESAIRTPGSTRDTSVGCDQSKWRNLLMVNVLGIIRLRVGFARGRTCPLWNPMITATNPPDSFLIRRRTPFTPFTAAATVPLTQGGSQTSSKSSSHAAPIRIQFGI